MTLIQLVLIELEQDIDYRKCKNSLEYFIIPQILTLFGRKINEPLHFEYYMTTVLK